YGDDVPLRRASHARDGGLPDPADDRNTKYGVPAHEVVRLLDLPVRRPRAVWRLPHEYRRRRGLVRLRTADRTAIRHRQTGGFLERSDHVHRGDGIDGRGRYR